MEPSIPFRKITCLLTLMVAILPVSAQFKADFKLKPDDFTVLMGVDAELSEGLRRGSHSGHGKFQVADWTRAGQSATWKITAPAAEPYEVFVLVKRANNQPLAFTLDAAFQSVHGTLLANPYSWQRVKLDGLLNLPAGESTVTLRIAAPDGKSGFNAEVHAIELVRPEVRQQLHQRALALRADTGWLQQARYGMMVHWTKQSMPLQGEQKSYEQAVADFNVEKFADTMKSTGAGFVVFTTSHAMQYFPAPLKSLDAILPGRTTSRDLPADLAGALNKRGMKLFLYYHLGAQDDPEWLKASGFWETDTSKVFNHWKAIIAEAGERYGDKLAGWWFDDGATSYYYRSAPWESLAKAAKAGNPHRLVSFNAWEMNNPTEFHDYCTGEACYEPRGIDALLMPESKGVYRSGTHAGLQASACLIADANWVHASKDMPLSAPKWNAAQLAERIRQFMAYKNVPIFNLEVTQDGQLSSQSIAVFREAATQLAAAQPDLTQEAEVNGERTPADAYGGNRKVEQPLTPAEAKAPFLIPDEITPGPFKADWKSFTADKLQREPAWWREAKIGVWFHWGPQAMGRNGDWYARFLYQQPPQGRQGRANARWMYDEHLKRYGHPSEFGYMDVLNAWKASKFDPAKLMKLYAESGARYILVQGAHHDNFDLWNSKYQPWNSVNVGPKRDIVGEMFREARKYNFRTGMAFHADYSLWWFQPAFGADKTGPKAGVPYDAAIRTKESGKGKGWEGLDPKDLYGIDLQAEVLPGQNIRDGFFTPVRDMFVHPETRAFAREYTLKWFHRVKQFVDDYDPDMFYTDGTEPFTGHGTAKGVISDAAVKVVAHMYNQRAAKNGGRVDCMAVIKGGPRIPGIAAPHENGYTGPIKREPWVWENTVGEWFFEDNTFYDSRAMILQMIEAISRDGNFNLNIGLTPEGELEPGGVKMWQDFGEFTRRNAAAIYGSSAWNILGEDATGGQTLQAADVTGKVRALVSNGKRDLTISVPTLGGDPAPGVPKVLTVRYRLDGKSGAISRAEGEQLNLGGTGAIEILDARFGPAASSAIPRAFPSGPIVREHAQFAMATSDVRFTQGKDRAVYAFIMAVPQPGEVLRIRSLGRNAGLLESPPRTVELLGSHAQLDWKQEADALAIQYPQSASLPFAVVFRIK